MSYIIKYLFHKYTHTQTHPLSQTLYMMIVNTILKMKITASFAIQLDFKKKYTLTPPFPPPQKKRKKKRTESCKTLKNLV